MSNWLRRVWHLLNRRRYERQLVDEMNEHRASMHDPSKFGDTHRLLERSRDEWGWNWLDDAVRDLHFGTRALLRSPVFTITAVLILSFGIGLNLTVFQMANVGLLKGPAIPHPETFARFHRHGDVHRARANSEAVPYAMAQVVARENTVLSAVLTEASAPVVWADSAQVLDASFVSANWFMQFGYGPQLGRVFTLEIDGAVDGPPSMIASYRFWKTTLGGDSSVIGTTQRINNRDVTLIGVMPENFPEMDQDASAVWLPINQRDYYFPNSNFLTDWDSNNVAMYGRFKDGVSQAAAREGMRAVMASLHRDRPASFDADEWLEPATAETNFTEPAERLGFIGVASMIGLLTTMVLLVAAANLGNVVMSRATSRVRELGMRVALGAGRSRIVRQLVIEAVPLGMIGAAGGLLFSTWTANTIAAIAQAPAYFDFSPDRISIAVSAALATCALAVVGALPAWKISKQDLTDAIKDGGQQVSIRLDRARVRSLMLAAQVGGSCLILIVSAMMVRSLQTALTADPGFDYERGALLQAGLAQAGLKGDAARAFWTSVKERVSASPDVEAAALTIVPPFSRGLSNRGRYDGTPLRVMENHVGPEYFSVLGIPIVTGRTFAAADDAETAVVISRGLALAMYGTTEILGEGFPKTNPHDTIIGIAADTSSVRPGDSTIASVYRPLAQEDFDRVVLLARARTSTNALLAAMREAGRIDPHVFSRARLLRDDFDRRMSTFRITSGIAASIGILTLLLACIGIFGVVSYGVTLRTKEVGIYLALGAHRGSIVRTVTRNVALPVLGGVTVGSVMALPIGFALANSGSPLQLAFADPVSYASGLLMLMTAAGVAALTPAWRAVRGNPISALRHE